MTTATISRRRKRTTTSRTKLGVFRSGKRTSSYYGLVIILLMLSFIGMTMIMSASSVRSLTIYGDTLGIFKRQVISLGIGAGLLILSSRLDYRLWRKLSIPLMAGTIGLLFLVLIPGIGELVNGSRRWLGSGSLQFQPSEIAKFALIIFIADQMAKHPPNKRMAAALKPVVAVCALTIILIGAEPDMGTALVTSGIIMTMLFAAGTPIATMRNWILLLVIPVTAYAVSSSYRRARIETFLHPWRDASNKGYQAVQGLVGLGSGGLMGVGLGASRAKWGFLPNADSDFIFAVIGEELGFIGAITVIGLFLTMAIIGIRVARRAPDRFGSLVAAGISAWIFAQALLNIGAVVGLFPVTGVPLPFISLGGSSMIVMMAATGVLLNIASQCPETWERKRA